jgi:DNA-binding XRE family transcriptional regulator
LADIESGRNQYATYILSTNSHHAIILIIMSQITEILGRRVRYFRKLESLSQEELASACDLHRTYIGGIERGERNVSLNNIERIAKALKVPVAYLLIESDSEDEDGV